MLGGGSGTSLPAAVVVSIAPTRQLREDMIYWIALGLVVAVLALIVLLLRSRYGLALKPMRDSELAASCSGASTSGAPSSSSIVTAFATAMIGARLSFCRSFASRPMPHSA